MIDSRTARAFAKQCLYSSGLLGRWHRLRNRRRLTVVIFHRVLPAGHVAWKYSDSAWVVSETAFRQCLRFFKRHYSVLDLASMLAISEGRQPAPVCPLLITFDDGWSDTAEYALPILREYGMPAAVFVVAGSIGRREIWQEGLIRVFRQGRLTAAEYGRLWSASAGPIHEAPPAADTLAAVWALIGRLSRLDSETRSELLSGLLGGAEAPRRDEMLSATGLRSLVEAGISIGSHTLTHTPIPYAADPRRELAGSREALASVLADPDHPGLRTFAFPRGIYDARALNLAAEAGYSLLFTSDERLNPIPFARLAPAVLGRINIPFGLLTNGAGRFTPAALAAWLFLRPATIGRQGLC